MYNRSLVLATILFFTFTLAVQAAVESESASEIKVKIDRLTKSADALKLLHEQLTSSQKEVFKLHQRARRNLQDNAYKIYMKGSLDIYNKVYAPLNSALAMVTEIYLNLTLEPKLWTVTEDRVALRRLADKAARENPKLDRMYKALANVLKAKMGRFDDDKRHLPLTAPFWRDPDGQPDEKQELLTRKLNCIIRLSDKVYLQTEAHLKRIRSERRQIMTTLKGLRAAYQARLAEEKKAGEKAKETAAWHKRLEERRKQEERASQPAKSGPGHWEGGEWVREQPEVIRHEREREAQRRARPKVNEKLRRQKAELLAKAEAATVYVDQDSPREVSVGETAVFLARMDPPDVQAYFKWTIDDRMVRSTKKYTTTDTLRYNFLKEDIYDLQVYVQKRNQGGTDTYTDQIKVTSLPKPAAPRLYPPELEGKKTKALDIPCCKYWILHKGGKAYLTGYYYTFSRQKVEYTSLSIKSYNPSYPAAGLFALANGTGYHVYQTHGPEQGGGATYIITRMKGSEVKIIHRLQAHKFSMKPGAGNRTWTVEYKTSLSGPIKRLVLD